MELRQRYLGAVSERVLSTAETDVSPSLMCQACVDVLPVEGAGISLSHRALRVPLGWSDPSVGAAERAQTTVGAGPCLSAASTGGPLAADAAAIAVRWPVYWGELHRSTPFRSVASLPLRLQDQPIFGALDLYASSTDLSSTLDLTGIAEAVAGPVSIMLSGAFDRLYDEEFSVPDWLTEEPAVQRVTVWTAVGMVVAASGHTDADALATIRAWAYSHGRSLDDVAVSLTDRHTSVESLLTDA